MKSSLRINLTLE